MKGMNTIRNMPAGINMCHKFQVSSGKLCLGISEVGIDSISCVVFRASVRTSSNAGIRGKCFPGNHTETTYPLMAENITTPLFTSSCLLFADLQLKGLVVSCFLTMSSHSISLH
jgi:hypothetical protein